MTAPERKLITLDDLQKSHIERHQDPYYAWIRHVVSLSVASLTGLIALQGSYLPNSPQFPIFLVLCWLGLLSSVLLGTVALANQHKQHLQMARRIQKDRLQLGDAETTLEVSKGRFLPPPTYHKWAVRLMAWCFAFSLCSLFAFATINLLCPNGGAT